MNNYAVAAIGNATIDVTCSVSEEQLLKLDLGVPKSSCAFLDFEKLCAIETSLRDWDIVCENLPGGSAANTMCTIAALGGKAAFIGKVADDAMGALFTQSMAGVTFPTPPLTKDTSFTTRLFAFITPDGERTFATYHGATNYLGIDDVDADLIASSQVVFLEGYQLATANGYVVMMRAIEIARKHKRLIVFSPSSLSVLDTWPEQARALADSSDGILCNEEEARHAVLKGAGKFICVTMGAKGAMADWGGERVRVPVPDGTVTIVNTNGAGDAFAGGFLFGLTKGLSLAKSLALGNVCAIHVLGQIGPRPVGDLKDLL